MARVKKTATSADPATASADPAPASTDPVEFTATDNFGIEINGTICTFSQGQTIVADATMQAALAAANAPVA
ncbi:hypothetical protein [Cupriavidus basilensis]|uniref:hypothetical protein n=1 Tax=Cupriavidus basilensis TaxID=68895 RepID=UPI0039F6A4CB